MAVDMGLNFLSWNWLPLLPIFVVYLISGLAECNRHPFDVVEGESEIVAGHMVEYSGMSLRHVLPGRIRQHDPDRDAGVDHVPGRLVVRRSHALEFGGVFGGWFWLCIKTFFVVVAVHLGRAARSRATAMTRSCVWAGKYSSR